MQCTTQVTLIEFIGAFVPIEVAFEVEMPKVDIAVQKNLVDALAFIASGAKALLLREAQRGGCFSDSGDAWLVQSSSLIQKEIPVSLDVYRQVLHQVGI